MMNLKQKGRYLIDLHNENKKRPILTAGNISYVNWWKMNPSDYWFTRFVRHYFPDEKKKIRFYSVFGPRGTLDETFEGVKIFFSGENLEEGIPYNRLKVREISAKIWENRRRKFGDYGAGKVDLSMGFPVTAPKDAAIDVPLRGTSQPQGNGTTAIGVPDGAQQSQTGAVGINATDNSSSEDCVERKFSDVSHGSRTAYLRFPLWITYLFEPEDDLPAIQKRIQEINQSANPVSAHGIACIASHDFFGTRTDICDCLESEGMRVDYAGPWRHNTDILQEDFGDDKVSYLHSKRFNICPENLDTPGYVTEKLFDAFRSGTIPIYHGSQNHPEEGLINPDAVLFWSYGERSDLPADQPGKEKNTITDKDDENQKVISRIRELESDDSAYLDFMRQTKLYDACADYVWGRLTLLKEQFETLFS